MKYQIRYVHKISPRESDVETRDLPDRAFSDSKTLGKALRETCILNAGDRVRSFRVEGERVIVFPAGQMMIWHSLILTPCPQGPSS